MQQNSLTSQFVFFKSSFVMEGNILKICHITFQIQITLFLLILGIICIITDILLPYFNLEESFSLV